METTRAGRYGWFRARNLDFDIIQRIPEGKMREWWLREFLDEFKKYSLKGRKKGELVNEGCRWELDDVREENYWPCNPRERAKVEKEGMQLTYLKETTSARIMRGFLGYWGE